ncbi:MAG: hypothetical protein FD180_4914 [Planctomycetota bacterium]|nr:MAG: hypothetical protein FD180_4914 [Planctomycetota bacterium]
MFEIKTGTVPRGPAKTPLAVALLFGLFALIFGGVGVGMSIPCIRASRWPTAPGTVLESSLRTSSSKKGGNTHACSVRYEFEVGGKRFTGDKLEPFVVYTSGNGPYEDLKRYSPGAACEVHYDPENPNESCLRPELGVLQWVFTGVGFLMLVIGIGIGFTGWWQRGAPGRA